jgi:hypothetical protein
MATQDTPFMGYARALWTAMECRRVPGCRAWGMPQGLPGVEMPEINPVRKQPPSGSHFTAIGLVPASALDTLGVHRLPV